MTLVARRRLRPILVGLAASALGVVAAGCAGFGPTTCDTGIVPAVTVRVTEAGTGRPLADGAMGVVTDGAYRDSLRIVQWDAEQRATHLGAADARPGTYTIVVQHPGYAPWTATGVRTSLGGCHARAPEQQAVLTPAS
jgi:hypothetical protein